MLFYAAKTIHASAKGKTNWSEPFSSLRWIKRPAERQFACCIVLADTDRYLGCGFEQKKWNSTFLPECKPVAYILEECLSWKPVKLCQRWISALLLCHVAVFFVAPGLIAAPEEFLHLLKDACFVSFFLSSYHSAFCSPYSHSNSHTRTCCNLLTAPLYVSREGLNPSLCPSRLSVWSTLFLFIEVYVFFAGLYIRTFASFLLCFVARTDLGVHHCQRASLLWQ